MRENLRLRQHPVISSQCFRQKACLCCLSLSNSFKEEETIPNRYLLTPGLRGAGDNSALSDRIQPRIPRESKQYDQPRHRLPSRQVRSKMEYRQRRLICSANKNNTRSLLEVFFKNERVNTVSNRGKKASKNVNKTSNDANLGAIVESETRQVEVGVQAVNSEDEYAPGSVKYLAMVAAMRSDLGEKRAEDDEDDDIETDPWNPYGQEPHPLNTVSPLIYTKYPD